MQARQELPRYPSHHSPSRVGASGAILLPQLLLTLLCRRFGGCPGTLVTTHPVVQARQRLKDGVVHVVSDDNDGEVGVAAEPERGQQ